MLRYLRIYLAFVRNCAVREMEFRTDLVLFSVSNVLTSALLVLMMAFLFARTREIAGWTAERVVLVTGTQIIVTAMLDFLFFKNMSMLSRYVNRGELDMVLVKPLNSQFLVSLRYVDFSQLPSMVVGAAYVIGAVQRAGIAVTPLSIALYLALLGIAVVMFYSLWFLTVTLVLYVGRINNIQYLIYPLIEQARLPTDVFRGPLRLAFSFILPIAFVATVPAKALSGLLEPGTLLYGLAFAAVTLGLSVWFWNFSLKQYSGASA
jgi:ABC-2 type transport system permease protein